MAEIVNGIMPSIKYSWIFSHDEIPVDFYQFFNLKSSSQLLAFLRFKEQLNIEHGFFNNLATFYYEDPLA